jgi:hypothetical protein
MFVSGRDALADLADMVMRRLVFQLSSDILAKRERSLSKSRGRRTVITWFRNRAVVVGAPRPGRRVKQTMLISR